MTEREARAILSMGDTVLTRRELTADEYAIYVEARGTVSRMEAAWTKFGSGLVAMGTGGEG